MSPPELLNEIRSTQIVAPAELRERVRGIAAAVPPTPPRRELPWRRWSLVLLPACGALAATGALVAGLVT
jgi:hypothetical protein